MCPVYNLYYNALFRINESPSTQMVKYSKDENPPFWHSKVVKRSWILSSAFPNSCLKEKILLIPPPSVAFCICFGWGSHMVSWISISYNSKCTGILWDINWRETILVWDSSSKDMQMNGYPNFVERQYEGSYLGMGTGGTKRVLGGYPAQSKYLDSPKRLSCKPPIWWNLQRIPSHDAGHFPANLLFC